MSKPANSFKKRTLCKQRLKDFHNTLNEYYATRGVISNVSMKIGSTCVADMSRSVYQSYGVLFNSKQKTASDYGTL
jgi:hypothetical protein